MEQRKRKRAAGTSVLGRDLWVDRPADRRAIWRMGELWKHAFHPREAVKNCWELCEDCGRIRRKRDRKAECVEGHLVWSTMELKETYPLRSAKDLMVILNMMKKDRTGDDNEAFQLPLVPRNKKKTKNGNTVRVEEKAPVQSTE